MSQSSGGTHSFSISRGRDYLLGTTEKIPPEDRERIQSPKCLVLTKRQDDG
jgi:hypothetical protein